MGWTFMLNNTVNFLLSPQNIFEKMFDPKFPIVTLFNEQRFNEIATTDEIYTV